MKILITVIAIAAIALVIWQSKKRRPPVAQVAPSAPDPVELPPVKPASAKIVSREVTFTIPEERKATCGDEGMLLPGGTKVAGTLTLEASDGPLGIREYDHPSFLSADVVFKIDAQTYRYRGLISQWDLWAPNGTPVVKEKVDFRDETGQLDGMMDGRDDWHYVLPDGSTHANRLKYTSCQFWGAVQSSSLDVKCRYYDQNPDITDYVTIFYTRPLAELLLLRDTRVFLDAQGNPEDFSLHDGEVITLEKL